MRLKVKITPTIVDRPKDFEGLCSDSYTLNGSKQYYELADMLNDVSFVVMDWWARMKSHENGDKDQKIIYLNQQIELFREKIKAAKFD